jgi:hypothetical protein
MLNNSFEFSLFIVIIFEIYILIGNGAIREFHSILRAAMMGARKAGILNRLINDQTLPGILAKMHLRIGASGRRSGLPG